MWQIKSDKEGEVYPLIIDKEVIVGRKSCDIIITDDQSVSRKHAILRTSYPVSNLGDLKFKPVVTLKDSSSKYGTFVNGKLIDEHGTLLKNGDLVTFGQCGSNFSVSYTPMVVTTSCMEQSEKSALKELVHEIGGHVIDEWNTECTHLAMAKVKVTVKTVCALVSKKPIVLAEYFKMLLDSYNNRKEPEDMEKFLPPVNEVLLTDNTNFHVDPNREQLFKEKTFVFLSVQQYKKLHLPITLASGKTVLMNRSRCDITPELLLSSCVIQCPVDKDNSSTQSQSQTCSRKEIEDIIDLLQKHKKRLIPESDIGLAIVHCSTEQYCNPDYIFDKTQSTFLSNEHFKIQSQTLSQNFVYVSETMPSTQAANENSIKSDCENSFKSSSVNTLKRGIIKEIPSSLRSDIDGSMTNLSVSETEERSSLNLPKIQRSSKMNEPEKPSTLNIASFSLDTSARNSTASTASELSSIRSKRPSENENDKHLRNTKREKLDLKGKSINPGDVKVEPLSPTSPTDTKENNYESIFDADTQPSSQTLFKNESYNTELKPNEKPAEVCSDTHSVKRQRNNSDAESNKKLRLSHNTTEETSLNKTNGDSSLAGYLNSKLSNKNSTIIGDRTEVNEDILCRSLRVVKIVDLVITRPPLQNKTNANLDSIMKNFKKFKKSSHVGASRMPTIIGGIDLIVHTSKQNLSELNDLLLNQETQNTQPSVSVTGNTSFKANFTKKTGFK